MSVNAPTTIIMSDQDQKRLQALVRDGAARDATSSLHLTALSSAIDSASVVAPEEVPGDVVTMNSSVRLRDLDHQDVEHYTLVYPRFADASAGRISVLAPLGTAILGRRIGDVVDCIAPAGAMRLRIEDILVQPESEGRYDV